MDVFKQAMKKREKLLTKVRVNLKIIDLSLFTASLPGVFLSFIPHFWVLLL